MTDCCRGQLSSEFDIDNATVDNDISAFNDAICFIPAQTEEVIYQIGNLKELCAINTEVTVPRRGR